MQTIEGVIARGEFIDGLATLTVFPMVAAPMRHIDPSGAVELTLLREAWQTEESHRAHVDHLVGTCAIIDYTQDATPLIAGFRNR